MAEKNGNPATQKVEVGENYLTSVEKTTESASDDDDHRRRPQNSSSPGFIHKKLPNKNNGDEISITKKAILTLTTTNKLKGAYMSKGRWFSEIVDPFTKRKIYLGTFKTPEEASNAFAAKKLEFCNRKESLICIDDRRRPAKSPSNKRLRVDHETIINNDKESSTSREGDAYQTRNTPNKFRGVRREKTGRWGARTKDPFSKRYIWLGTFDTPEEASIVYEAKRLEFLNRKEGLIHAAEDKEDHRRLVNSSPVNRPRVFHKKLIKSDNGDQKSSTKEVDLTGTTQTKLIGAYKKKSGRWTSEIKNPFDNHRRIHLGMFDTPEEASNAFLAKKLEFQKRKEAGEQVKADHWKVWKPAKSFSIKPPRVVHETILNISNGDQSSGTKEVEMTTQTTTPNKFVGAYPRKSGKWFSNIKDPFTRCNIHLGEFDSQEEASNAYVAKKLEFLKLKEARICVNRTPTECVSVRSWEQSDQCAESSSFEDDGRKLEDSLLLNNNGKEVDHKLRGVRLQKTGRCGAKIRDRFRKLDIWLGTFDTLEEASNIYAAKRLDFNQRKKGPIRIDGTRPVSESGRSVEQNDDFESSSYNDCQQREPQLLSVKRPGVVLEKVVLNKFRGVRRKKTGRWGGMINDISKHHREPQSLSVKRPGVALEKVVLNGNKGDEKFKTKKTNLTETTLNKFPGAIQRKSGKWSAEIIDPFDKRPIWFGSFDTPEEASNFCAAKKLEFLERKEAQICMDGHNFECESGRSGEQIGSTVCSYHEDDQLTPAKSSSINIKPPTVVDETLHNSNNGVGSSSGIEADLARTMNKFQGMRREKTGSWGAAMNDPFTKRQIWLGTFDTPEEASKVYAAKRLEFNERKEAKICMDRGRIECVSVKCGQQFDVGQISEPILIDSNGFLLGEFSNLDDELRIL